MSDDQKPNEQQNGEPPAPADELLELAKAQGFTDKESFLKKVKNVRKWETEVNTRHQEVLRSATASPKKPEPDPDLAPVSPQVKARIEQIVRETVQPLVEPLSINRTEELTDTVQDFLDEHPEISQAELFDVMGREELWPDEAKATRRVLKRRLHQGYRILTESEFDEKAFREKIRKEEAEKLAKEGGKVVSVTPKSSSAESTASTRPDNWVTRMQKELQSD